MPRPPLPEPPPAGDVVRRIINGLIVGFRALEDLVNLVGTRARGIDYTPGDPPATPSRLDGPWCGTRAWRPDDNPPPALLSEFDGPDLKPEEESHERPDHPDGGDGGASGPAAPADAGPRG